MVEPTTSVVVAPTPWWKMCIGTSFIFSVSLAVLLQCSIWFLLPMLTTVKVNGTPYTVHALATLERTLEEEIQGLLRTRQQAVQPIRVPEYNHIIDSKHVRPSLIEWFAFAQKIQTDFTVNRVQTVFINSTTIQTSTAGIELHTVATVRNVDDDVLSIATQLRTALESFPNVRRVTSESFVRQVDEDGVPFTTVRATLHF